LKLGDSLGRSRRRRKGKGDSDVLEDSTEAGAEEPGEGSGAEEPGDGSDTTRAPFGGSGTGAVHPWLQGRNLVIGVASLALIGWIFGYGVATRVLFPAPPPPGDLFDVPDLRGLGFPIASERVAGAGLTIGAVDSLQHPSVPGGQVLGQSPLPGQVLLPERPVDVTISAGPQTLSVPDVTSLDEERARIVLETSGFIVSTRTVEAEAPRGRVVSISPRPDSAVALPAEVTIFVSAGPPVVAMPLVLGLERAEAEAMLDSLGLVVSDVEEVFRFGRDQGIVVEQEPAADTELERGTSVRLKVGRGGRDGGRRRPGGHDP